ncbi:hypothetical protein [Corynebacterium crudilactis]|uniref:Uncharacterized protein n=1 Tax=Corynebacterium crudilactis TaxID=1652495 RepID=A0A172QY07_9CORY|nr:hypothetical protein [Corynebacterium crudilactis]ANE05526.1 hypothetical protein ccrud_14390 [Corynebacterium crudilactis]
MPQTDNTATPPGHVAGKHDPSTPVVYSLDAVRAHDAKGRAEALGGNLEDLYVTLINNADTWGYNLGVFDSFAGLEDSPTAADLPSLTPETIISVASITWDISPKHILLTEVT